MKSIFQSQMILKRLGHIFSSTQEMSNKSALGFHRPVESAFCFFLYEDLICLRACFFLRVRIRYFKLVYSFQTIYISHTAKTISEDRKSFSREYL